MMEGTGIMKQLLFIAILAIASGCGSLGTQKIVKDPVHSIRESLPAGWVIKDIQYDIERTIKVFKFHYVPCPLLGFL